MLFHNKLLLNLMIILMYLGPTCSFCTFCLPHPLSSCSMCTSISRAESCILVCTFVCLFRSSSAVHMCRQRHQGVRVFIRRHRRRRIHGNFRCRLCCPLQVRSYNKRSYCLVIKLNINLLLINFKFQLLNF